MDPRNHGRASVAVLAHNEADRIQGSLEALCAAGLGPDDQVHVMINGSTDATAEIVQAMAKADRRIAPHVLDFGDKSNAWNTYVYRHAPKDHHHIFLDGDVRPAAGAVTELLDTLDRHPEALASSALPAGGRRSQAWAQKILENHGLPGNLYALRDATLERIKAERIFLPVGFVGDDTILRWLLLRDLNPTGATAKTRIRPAAKAYFEYESFPVMSGSGLTALYKRQKRYSRRDLEVALLTDRLQAQGIGGLPRYASELYGAAKLSTPLRAGLIPRQVLAVNTVLAARRNQDKVPASDPWAQLFGT